LDTSKVAQQYRLNQWARIIRECRSSGQTVKAWCTEHNIKQSSYFYWLRRVRKAACEALPALNTGETETQIVEVNFPPDKTAAAKSFNYESSPDIILRIGSVTMEVHKNASQEIIENTLRALGHVR